MVRGAEMEILCREEAMKITIDISELDAACVWSNAFAGKTVSEAIADLAKSDARAFRQMFPPRFLTSGDLVKQFREHRKEVAQ